MTLYIFTNGTDADADEVNSNISFLTKLQLETLANNVSSSNSQELVSSALKIVDKFTDSTGENNTVDTGNTDAVYDTDNNYYRCKYAPLNPNPVGEPSFETITGWSYSETDSDWNGSRSTTWKTDGTYSYKFYATGEVLDGRYAQISRSVDFTNIKILRIDFHTSAFLNVKSEVRIGSTVVATNPVTTNFEIDVSAFTGSQNLIFRLEATGTTSTIGDWYIDNIRAYDENTYADSTIESESIEIDKITRTLTDNTSSTIINPDFESGSGTNPTGWTYTETDTHNILSGATNTSSPIGGSQDYKFTLNKSSSGSNIGSCSAYLSQSVDSSKINKLVIKDKSIKVGGTGSHQYKIKVYLDSTVIYSSSYYSFDTTHTTTITDLKYSGTKTLKVGVYFNDMSTGTFQGTVQIDDILTYKGTETYKNTIPTKVMITPLMYDYLENNDSMTFDITFNPENDYDIITPIYLTGNEINKWIDCSSLSNYTGRIKIKLNLDTQDGSTTPKVKGWAVAVSE